MSYYDEYEAAGAALNLIDDAISSFGPESEGNEPGFRSGPNIIPLTLLDNVRLHIFCAIVPGHEALHDGSVMPPIWASL